MPTADQTPGVPPASRLARRLTTSDAVIIGLGSMMGAGVFSAIGPAARAADNAVTVALLIAGALAICNAMSSAALAALYPQAGGAYVYGRLRLGQVWGYLAGWCFVVGKIASCAAISLTFGHYVSPPYARPLAVAAVVGLTALNFFGIRKTLSATKVIVALVLVALGVVIIGAWGGGTASLHRLWPVRRVSGAGVLQAAGLLFFAFAGYARIATLGEEVVNPRRTIPRAIPVALGIALVIYAAVISGAVAASGAEVLARAPAPLVEAMRGGRWASLAIVVRVGAALASLGVLLSLLVGVSRTMFAMAAEGDLPVWLAAVHPRHRVPHRAEIVVGVVVACVVASMNVGAAIGFSSFAVLAYYAVANAAALTLKKHERPWTGGLARVLALLGFVGCVIIASSLPTRAVVSGSLVVVVGLTAFGARRLGRPAPKPPSAKG